MHQQLGSLCLWTKDSSSDKIKTFITYIYSYVTKSHSILRLRQHYFGVNIGKNELCQKQNKFRIETAICWQFNFCQIHYLSISLLRLKHKVPDKKAYAKNILIVCFFSKVETAGVMSSISTVNICAWHELW